MKVQLESFTRVCWAPDTLLALLDTLHATSSSVLCRQLALLLE